jgi:hypothetical protein
VLSCSPRFRWRTQMDEQRKYASLFAATILAPRKLSDTNLNALAATQVTRLSFLLDLLT